MAELVRPHPGDEAEGDEWAQQDGVQEHGERRGAERRCPCRKHLGSQATDESCVVGPEQVDVVELGSAEYERLVASAS